SGYILPKLKPLSADEERNLARIIQAGNNALDRIAERLKPVIEATLSSVDTSPLDTRTLLAPALVGVRQAAEGHAASGKVDGEFITSAAPMIQRAVAEYIDRSDKHRWACGGDGAGW